MTTLVRAWGEARERLKAAGVDSPVMDARLLVELATGASRAELLSDPHRPLAAGQVQALDGFVERRRRREPMSHILGRKGFWSILLKVGPQVLTPRPETELLVEWALQAFAPDARLRVLDLGVGSGAILLALLAERPAATGLGVDVSEEALAMARDNAAALGLRGRAGFLRGDWTAGLAEEGFDLVVSNPPYIPSGEIAGLEPEVREHEPRLALDGGPDGLDAYRRLAPEILRVLRPAGRFAVEIGPGQAGAVRAMFEAAGAVGVEVAQDLGGCERIVTGSKSPLGIPADNR